MSSSRQYVRVLVPADRVRANLPDAVDADGHRLEVGHEVLGAEAVRGDGARRYRVRWSDGPWVGSGMLDVRPQSSYATELVLEIERPRGVRAALAWAPEHVEAAAEALALALRRDVERFARPQVAGPRHLRLVG